MHRYGNTVKLLTLLLFTLGCSGYLILESNNYQEQYSIVQYGGEQSYASPVQQLELEVRDAYKRIGDYQGSERSMI